MTTPPIEPPDEPQELPPAGQLAPHAPRYETGPLVITTLVTVIVLTGLTLLNYFLGLLAPLTLIVALFFIRATASARRRSIVTGIILGSGIGLLTTAGVCTGILTGSSSA
jgi:hypothetical protein